MQIPKALGLPSGSAFGIAPANTSVQVMLGCRKKTISSLCGHQHVVISHCNPQCKAVGLAHTLQGGVAAR